MDGIIHAGSIIHVYNELYKLMCIIHVYYTMYNLAVRPLLFPKVSSGRSASQSKASNALLLAPALAVVQSGKIFRPQEHSVSSASHPHHVHCPLSRVRPIAFCLLQVARAPGILDLDHGARIMF